MNLRVDRWNRWVHLRFRLPRSEACTPRSVAIRFRVTLAQPHPRSHHVQSREINLHRQPRRISRQRANSESGRRRRDLRTNGRGWQAERVWSQA